MDIKEIDAVLERAKETAQARAEAAVPVTQKRKRLRPRHQWVLIRKIDPRDRITQSGMVITEGQARSSIGEVISFSGEVTDLMRGDIVLFTNFAMKLDELEDATGEKNLYLVREDEIYTVLEDEPEVTISASSVVTVDMSTIPPAVFFPTEG